MTRTILLLTYNEAAGVAALADALQRFEAEEILAIDGGSTDGTVERLAALGITVYQQTRRGRGAAIREGVAATRGDHIVLFSPDGNEDPAGVPRLFDLLAQGCDMAVASRFLPGSVNEEDQALLPARKWANLAFRAILHWRWAPRGVRVTDPINGFRGFTRRAFLVMSPQSDHFTIEYEMTQRAFVLGLKIAEIPTQEGRRLGGRSKAPSLRTGISFMRFVIGQWLRGQS